MGFDLLGQTNMFCLIMYDDALLSIFVIIHEHFFTVNLSLKKQTKTLSDKRSAGT